MDIVIEGGIAGGSALQDASQRRATADRLVVEAKWLETVAADERAMAGHLAKLPPAYAIMHDLKVAGSKGNIDHLVVGPGGAFIVVTRRFAAAIAYRDGQLWAGEQALRSVLDAARVESQLLTQSLGTPVVPVVGLLGAILPAATPHAVDGVLVCAGDNVVRVITRGSHTLLPPHKVGEAAERALSLLHNPGSVTRSESGNGARSEREPDTSVHPLVQQPVAPHAESAQLTRDAGKSAKKAAKKAGQKPGRKSAEKPGGWAAALASTDPSTPRKERSGAARSVRFVAIAIVSLCLVAVALGSVAKVIWSDEASPDDSAGSGTTLFAPSTSAAVVPVEPLAAAVLAPLVEFAPLCPAPGAGWQLLPTWPGDLAGLVEYEVEQQYLDGTWTRLNSIVSADTSGGSLLAQPANAALNLRITAVMVDGSRSVNQPTVVTTPAEAC